MAYTSVTATCGETTIEVGYGTDQEIADRIAVLMTDRTDSECQVIGWGYDGQVHRIMLRYLTTARNP
jgi:hypothetical protein